MKKSVFTLNGLALAAASLLILTAASTANACPAPTVKTAGTDSCSTSGIQCNGGSGGSAYSLTALVNGTVSLPAIVSGADATYLINNDLSPASSQFTVTLTGTAPAASTQYIECLNNLVSGSLGCQITGQPSSSGVSFATASAGGNFGPPTGGWPTSSGFMGQITFTGIPSGNFEITFPNFKEDNFTGTLSGAGYANETSSSCSGTTTKVTGTVYVPNGMDPLPNALVYIPSTVPGAIPAGVECLTNGNEASGNPVTYTYSAYTGAFTLTGVPAGTNIPIVIQSGKWRMQGTIPSVTACATTTAPTWATTMPSTHVQGDIPKIAVVTGNVDAAECVIYRSGVNTSEFTDPTGNGQINLYQADHDPGGQVDNSTPNESALTHTSGAVNAYDMIMFPCQGSPDDSDASGDQANILDWTNRGGRLFTTHYSYAWLYQSLNANTVDQTIYPNTTPVTYSLDTAQGPESAVQWAVYQSPNPADPNPSGTVNATVDTTFTEGSTLSSWLENTPDPAASPTSEGSAAQVSISTLRVDQDGVNTPTQSWLTLNSSYTGTPNGGQQETQAHPTMQLTFNAPVGADAGHQCGRVLYNDYHVYNGTFGNKTFPSYCPSGAMSAQEHLLEYALFDLTNAITPVTSAPPLTMSCSATTAGEVGVAFDSGTPTVSGGTSPYTFSVVGTLPAGLTLNTSTGEVTGTPTGTGTFSLQVEDLANTVATTTCPISISMALTVSCSPNTTGEVNHSFNSGGLTVGGGSGSYSYSYTGTLPTGLSFNSSNGSFSGTPTGSGSCHQKVTDTLGGNDSHCGITVESAVSLPCPTAVAGDVGKPYDSGVMVPTGGSPVYTYSIVGTLPAGLSLNTSTGEVTGTPTASGSFQIKVTDGEGGTATTCTITINAKPWFSCPTNSTGEVGVAYDSGVPTVGGGTTPYVFSIVGTLPAGLSLNTSTGEVKGTPTASGSFQIKLTDSVGGTAMSCTITIGAAPSITCPAATTGEVGVPYNSGSLAVTGGVTPFVFSVVGTLPTGLSLNSSTGAVTGTPTGTGSFQIKVTDKNGSTATSCAITIIAGLSVACPSATTGEVNVAYDSGALSPSGGSAPYTYSIVGTLPTGLSLNTSTGEVSGTPTTGGSFSIKVTDKYGATATTCSIKISIAPWFSCPANSTGQVGLAYDSGVPTVGGGVAPYTFSIAGTLPAGLSLNASTGEVSGTPTAAGSFQIQVSDANHKTALSCTIKIAAGGTISWGPISPIVYGTPLSSTQLDAQAYCNGNPITGGTYTYSETLGTVLNAGASQALSVTYVPPTSSVCNFSGVTTPNTITVTARPLTITANSYTIYYGSALPSSYAYAVTSTPGFVNGDTFASLSGLPVVAPNTNVPTPNPPVGTYTNDLVFQTPTPTDANYSITWVPGTLTVKAGTGNIQWGPLTAITYGTALGSGQLNAQAYCGGVAVSGGTYSYAPAAGKILNAGTNQTLSVTFTPPSGTSCTYKTTTTTLTVNPAPLTITANNVTIPYGQALPSPLTYSANTPGSEFVNGDTFYSLTSLPVVKSTAGAHPAAGTYNGALVFQTPTPTDANYTITWVPGNLTVTNVTGTITWPAETPITYGTPLSSTQLDAQAYCNGNPVHGGTYTYLPVSGTVLNAGPQTLGVVFTPPTGTACTFSSSPTNTTLQVNPAPLKIVANNVTIAYGSSLPALTYYVGTPGFVNGDTLASLSGTPVVSSTAGPNPAVGTYPFALVFTTKPTDSNYTITWVPGTLKVTSNTGSVVWAPPSPIVYGTALSGTQLDAQAFCGSNPVVGGTWTYTPSATTVLAAGTQTLSATFTPPSGVSCSYQPVTVPLLVTQAPLTVTANNATMYVGGTVPKLTYGITGFVNGDSWSVVHGTATLAINPTSDESNPGSYPGAVSFSSEGLTASNYYFNYVAGNLLVNANNGVITWPTPAAITYGTPLSSTQLDATATCDGNPVIGTYTYTPASGTVLSANPAVPLYVTFTPKSTSSCTFTQATVNLDVKPAVLTVKANNVTMPLGGPIPGFTDTIWGFVNGDNSGTVVISGSAPMTTTATTSSPSGSQWPITFNSPTLSATNYTFNYVPGVLTVGPPVDSAVTISFSNTNWNYPGEANVTICVKSTVSQAATGTIQLYDGSVLLATLPVQGGGCAYWYITPGLSAGTHVFTAYYSGDGNNPAGYSPQYPITVALAAMTMEASCWNQNFAYGANVNCNANTDSGPKSGYMTYVYDGGAPVKLILNSGGATAFTIPKPPVGNHSIIIAYPPQGKYAGVTLPVWNFTVTGAIDQVSLTPSTWNPTTISSVEFKAGVASQSAGAPDHIGTITFTDTLLGVTTTLGTVPVDANGKANFWTDNLPAGNHTITATYTGTNYLTNSISISLPVVAAKAAAKPTFSPAAGGTFTSAQSVSLLDSTPGAKIYYTTDGSTPTTSSTLFSTPIQVTSSETINAIAVASGYANSPVATGNFDILAAAAAPTFTPTPGVYASSIWTGSYNGQAFLSSSTPGAAIYYTTNGHTPTVNSTLYTGPIQFTTTTTIKAITTALGYSTSSVSTGTYTIQ